MKFHLERSWKLTKLSKILLGVLAAILLASGFFIYQIRNNHGVWSKLEDKLIVDQPMYYAIQENTAKIYIYDTLVKKNKELLSIPLEKDFYRFGADYSAKNNQIVYSDMTGVWSYDMASKEKKQLVANKAKSSASAEDDSEFYFNPKFSRDSGKIIFMTGYAEGPGAKINTMAPDGKDVKTIDKLYASTNGFRWTNDGRYVTGSGMDGSYFSVSSSNDLNKISNIDLTSKVEATGGYDLDISKNQLIVGSSSYDNKKANAVYSVNLDGTNVQKLADSSNVVSGLVYDPYAQKVIFSQTDWNNKKGLGLYQINDGKAEEYYKDGDKNITPVFASKDYVAASSNTFGETGFSMKTLFLINKSDKSVINIGEAGDTSFIGWIKSNRMPSDIKEVADLTPTAQEKEAYSDSQKSHGYLSGTYYDYCWDYDCQSPTYPYPKLSQSKMPEVVNLSQKPNLLTGNVTVPVVFAYDNTTFTPSQIDILKNNDITQSYGHFETWLNQQAQNNGAKLTFSLDYRTADQIKISQNCITTQGQTKLLDQTCILNQIGGAYTDLKDAPVILVALNRDSTGGPQNYTYNVSYSYSKNSIIYTSFYGAGKEDSNFQSNLQQGYYGGFSYYNIKQFLSQYGAKDKVASFKQPVAGAQSACYIDNRNDATCGAYWEGEKGYVSYITPSNETIGPVTAKELGWYDADGDKILEVNDKCPFDKNNKC